MGGDSGGGDTIVVEYVVCMQWPGGRFRWTATLQS